MRILAELRERVWALLFRVREEREMDEELRFHVEMQTERNARAGMHPEEARRQALIRLGGVERCKEDVRDARGARWVDHLVRDVRYALRRLGRQPGFSVPAILTLAIGIGAVAAIFALVNAVLLRPLPYHDSGRLVAIRHAAPGIGMREGGISEGVYAHYLKYNGVFDGMGLYYEHDYVTATDGDKPERLHVAMVTPSVFPVLGATPMLGRLFVEADAQPSASVPVVISHALWAGRYGADPGLIGRTIELNRVPRTVVGVLPAAFDFPSPATQVWYPIPVHSWTNVRAGGFEQGAIARLEPTASVEEAQADLQRLIPSLADAYSDVTRDDLRRSQLQAEVIPLKDAIVGDVRQPLVILLCTVGFVLIIAWANVANLFLVRSARQRREVAVVRALGAARGDLVRRFLSESLVLAGLGGVLGLALAYAAVQSRFGFQPGQIPRLHELHVGGMVVAVVAGLSTGSALLLAGISAVRAGRVDFAAALKGTLGRMTGGRDWQRAQRTLVALQVAFALTLLIGSAVMVQSFWRLVHTPLGFDPEGVLTFRVSLPYRGYETYQAGATFHAQLLDALRAVPGVSAAEETSNLPLTTPLLGVTGSLLIDGKPRRPGDIAPPVVLSMVTPGYFRMMRISLIGGRAFHRGDLLAASPAVIISAATARAIFGDQEPLGRRIRLDDSDFPWFTVVGIASDVPGETIAGGAASMLYIPQLADFTNDPHAEVHVPSTLGEMAVVVRTSVPSSSILPVVRRLIHDIDPKTPIASVRTMDQIVSASMARTRLLMLLLLVAGGTALLLGVIGLYGVVSYAVAERRPEISVRIALGASPVAVRRMVLRQSAVVATIGISIGVVTAFALTRFLRGLLYQVSPRDPLAFAAMAVLLFTVALVASYVPARRAGRIDPAQLLKAE